MLIAGAWFGGLFPWLGGLGLGAGVLAVIWVFFWGR